jgi:hypothetical protein
MGQFEFKLTDFCKTESSLKKPGGMPGKVGACPGGAVCPPSAYDSVHVYHLRSAAATYEYRCTGVNIRSNIVEDEVDQMENSPYFAGGTLGKRQGNRITAFIIGIKGFFGGPCILPDEYVRRDAAGRESP